MPEPTSVEVNNTDSDPPMSEDSVSVNASMVSTQSVEERISEILATLDSLSAELTVVTNNGPRPHSEVIVEDLRAIGTEPRVSGRTIEEPPDITYQHHRSSTTRVKLNVGGKIFHVSWALMLQVQNYLHVIELD